LAAAAYGFEAAALGFAGASSFTEVVEDDLVNFGATF